MRDSHAPQNANKSDRTWDQWYLMGYGVMVGEKPRYRVHGEAFYDENQVMKLTRMYGEFEPKPTVDVGRGPFKPVE